MEIFGSLKSVVNKGYLTELILSNNLLCDMFDWDSNILVFGHGGFKIKAFGVHCRPACIGHGDGGFHKSVDCDRF